MLAFNKKSSDEWTKKDLKELDSLNSELDRPMDLDFDQLEEKFQAIMVNKVY